MVCALGAPLPTPPLRSSQSIFNPFTTTHARNQETIYGIGEIVLGTFTPIVLLIIIFAIACEKCPRVKHAVASCCVHCASFDWSRLDVLFPDLHFRTNGHAMVFKKTQFGAAMSIATFLAFVGIGIALGVNSIMFSVYASSISPQPPPWEPRGVYQLVVTVFGGGSVDQCAGGPANGFGIFAQSAADWNVAPTSVRNAYNADGSCTLSWRCGDHCSMAAATSATLELRAPPRSWATHVSFAIATPMFASNTTPVLEFGSAPFQFQRSFDASIAAGQQTANASLPALRGTATVKLALTPYVVNSSSSETKAVAFEPSVLGISYGNITTLESFDFTQPDGFAVKFELSRNTLSLVFTASTSALATFLVLLASVGGSVLSIFSVLVKRLESMFEMRDTESKSGLEHEPQIDVDAVKGAPEGIELNGVHLTKNTVFSALESADAAHVHAEKIRMFESAIQDLKISNQQIVATQQQSEADHEQGVQRIVQQIVGVHQQIVAEQQQNEAAHQAREAYNQQSIEYLMYANQELKATLAELVQRLPVPDQLQQQHQPQPVALIRQGSSSSPQALDADADAASGAQQNASESITTSPSDIYHSHEQPFAAASAVAERVDGYGQMQDEE